MITPAYPIAATERVLPRLALDFTTAVLDPRVTLTRALNTATRFNSSGLIEIVNANLPRFDYDPATLACKGLLIEESRANLALYSSDYSTSAWYKGTVSISPDAVISPDGTSNADAATGTGSDSGFSQSIACTGGVTYTRSIWLKIPSGTRSVNIYGTDNGGGYAVTSASLTTAWKRFTVTATASAGATSLTFQVGGGNTWGNGVVIHAWGAQIEAGAFATSYIPTTTTSLTRNADVVSMTGTNFSSWFNASAGTFVAAATPYAIGSYCIFAATNGGFNNRMQAPAANSVQWLVGDGGAIQAFLDAGSFTAGAQAKVAASYKSNLFAVSLNGGTPASIASGTVPAVDRLDIGNLAGFAEFFNGWIPSIRYFPQSLTSAELQAFSK